MSFTMLNLNDPDDIITVQKRDESIAKRKKELDDQMDTIYNVYKNELSKYNCKDLVNLILKFAQYEKEEILSDKMFGTSEYGYSLFGKKHGTFIGTLSYTGWWSEEEYINGLYAKWTSRYPTGTKIWEGKYDLTGANEEWPRTVYKRDGVWTHWYQNGQPQEELVYDKGVMIKEPTYWDENGKQLTKQAYETRKRSLKFDL